MDSKQSFKILAVDDCNMNIELLRNVLEDNGYEVFTANNVTHALSLITEKNPDLVLLDLMMPRISGFTFIEKMKSISNEDILIIVISARTDNNDIQLAKKMGVIDYLSKPILFPRLLTTIETIKNKKYSTQL